MATKIKIASRYDYEGLKHPKVKFDPKDPLCKSVTNQSDKDSTDINKMMAKYEKTGMITDLITGNPRQPNYGDFSNVGDYHQLQNTIIRVNNAFNALPAKVRSRFENDPDVLIRFLADQQNDREAVELGLKDASVLPKAVTPPSNPHSHPVAPQVPPATPPA